MISAAVAVTLVASTLLDKDRPEKDQPPCRWLAGDLDVHTVHTATQVRDISSEDAATFALAVEEQADLARNRDLDYLAITDFDSISAQQDPAYGQDDLIWIPGYEHQFAGLAQLLGATKRYQTSASGPEAVRRVAGSLGASGGVLQVAHPGDRLWERAYGTSIDPDALEVWFNGPWAYDPGDVDKDMTRSIGFYDRLLDDGKRVAASGGSNSLLRGLYKLAGVGQPTTWACADERTSEGVLRAIRQGRTTISHEFPNQGPLTESEAGGGGSSAAESGSGGFTTPPPSGTRVPFVAIEGDLPGGTPYEASMGDVVSAGDQLRVGVFDGPFSVLRLVTDGSRVLDQVEVFTPTFVHEFTVPDDVSWIRAELYADPKDTIGGPCRLDPDVATYCDDRIGMLALTSPIYVSETPLVAPSPSGSTGP